MLANEQQPLQQQQQPQQQQQQQQPVQKNNPAKRTKPKPTPAQLHQQLQADIEEYGDKIYYSNRYSDDVWEYRHVTLPKQLAKYIPHPTTLLSENEWRGIGVRQSQGWEHYMIHQPEPHVLLFRREKDYQIKYPNGKPAQ